jgi:histidinol-phosphatase
MSEPLSWCASLTPRSSARDCPDWRARIDASADDLALAITLADAADALTMAGYRSSDLVVHTKPDLTPVTEVDQAVERALRDMLAVQRPRDAVIGEEYGDDSTAGRRWVIDPIDGTKNYVRGVPVWATLIALIEDTGEITVGVVSAPALQRRWWAATGHGAFTQGPEDTEPRRIAVSEVRDLADASVSVSDPIGWPDGSLDRLHQATWRLRAYGDFWSHLLVAEGAVDIAAEPELNLWDVAALVPIVVEAGGRITSFHGQPTLDSAITTNGHLHDAVIDLLH